MSKINIELIGRCYKLVAMRTGAPEQLRTRPYYLQYSSMNYLVLRGRVKDSVKGVRSAGAAPDLSLLLPRLMKWPLETGKEMLYYDIIGTGAPE